MANISPQDPNFNRNLWAQLEGWVRKLLHDDLDEVYIISGPVFAPVNLPDGQWVYLIKTIGKFPNLVSVPSHFFKVGASSLSK